MAVAMKDDFLAGQFRRLIAGRLGLQEAAEGEGLSAQALADAVVRKQVAQLVAENARATRLQHDDGQAGVNLVFHRVEHAQQIFFCRSEQSEVVKRSPAAKMAFRLRHVHGETGVPKYFVGGLADVRVEVVVPGVGKEHHFAAVASVTGLFF